MDENISFQNLKGEVLIDYLSTEIKKGMDKAELKCDEVLEEINLEITKLEGNQKLNYIFRILVEIKNANLINCTSQFRYFLNESKRLDKYLNKNDEDKIKNLSKFILEYFTLIEKKLLSKHYFFSNIGNISFEYFLKNGIFEKTQYLFKEIKTIEHFENFDWNYNNFEIGLLHLNKLIELDTETKIKLLSIEHSFKLKQLNFEIEVLNDKIKDLNEDNASSTNQLKNYKEYIEKYYDNSLKIHLETFFGENPLVVVEFFNFLKENKFLEYEIGYFCNCLLKNSNEILYLNKAKNFKVIGHLFYKLQKYINVNDKDFNSFFMSKFYFDKIKLSDSFYKNNVVENIKHNGQYDDFNHGSFIKIDDFIDKIDKLYVK